MSSKTDGPGPWTWGLLATVGVAAVLRGLGLQSGLWFDEIVTLLSSARHPFGQIVTEFPGVNEHPLYSVLAHASILVFGDSAWALRLPAAVFGVASVWMVYVLGVRLHGRVEAVAGAAILATSYHHIWFSQNARGYTMIGFFALASTYLLLRAGETRRSRDYGLYVLACVAGVYTHLTMVFVVAGQAAVMAAGSLAGWSATRSRPIRPLIWSWIAASGLSAIVYAPFVPALLEHLHAEAPRAAAQVATGSWAIAEAIRSLLAGAGVPGALLQGAVAIVGGFSLLRRVPLAVALLIAPAIIAAVVVIGLGQPLRPRFFFFLSGAGALFVGRGAGAVATALSRTRAAPAVAVAAITAVLIAASVVALPRNYRVPKQDFAGALAALDRAEANGAHIATVGLTCLPYDAYFGRHQWTCLKSADDLTRFAAAPGRSLVVYTLADYIDDAPLQERVRNTCAAEETFPGTLGGGEVVICRPRSEPGP
jgi:uncharacterized membrane protein